MGNKKSKTPQSTESYTIQTSTTSKPKHPASREKYMSTTDETDDDNIYLFRRSLKLVTVDEVDVLPDYFDLQTFINFVAVYSNFDYKKYLDQRSYQLSEVYIKRSNEIYCFTEDEEESSDNYKIHKYSFDTKKWTILSSNLLFGVRRGSGIVIGRDQRYVIILGGGRSFWSYDQLDDIQIFDVDNTERVFQCKIKLPYKGSCSAWIEEDENRNKLLIHGYARKFFKVDISSDLIKFMTSWYSTECVHIQPHDGYWIESEWVAPEIVKIDLEEIINNIIL